MRPPSPKKPRDGHVYFHIGLHKTATTWLQRHLFPNLPGVNCLVTKRIADITKPQGDAPTLIVSHEALSGTLSSEKQPGDNKKRLTETLCSIAAVAPGAPIIIGFREHRSWLSAAYAQKAKKQGVKLERYVATFSREDLSWCRSLDLIEDGKSRCFPFFTRSCRSAGSADRRSLPVLGDRSARKSDRALGRAKTPLRAARPDKFVQAFLSDLLCSEKLHAHQHETFARVRRAARHEARSALRSARDRSRPRHGGGAAEGLGNSSPADERHPGTRFVGAPRNARRSIRCRPRSSA